MIYCEQNNPHRFCNILAEAAADDDCKLARRPFNRFEPETTAWWLVPSSALPFYQFDKIYCNWTDKDRNKMLCGLYFEKGLAPELASVYPSRKGRSLLMNKKWYWHKFIKSCKDGSFVSRLREAAEKSGFSLEIHISGGYVDDPALFDPYGEKQKKDYYIFDLDKDLKTLNYRSAKRDNMLLKSLNKAKDIVSLLEIISSFDEQQFLWLDVYIAAPFGIPSKDSAESEIIPAAHIWKDFLKPLTK